MNKNSRLYQHSLTCIATGFVFMSASAMTIEPPRELLWPDGAPGAKGNDPANDQPAITIYSPPEGTANGTAVVICPGGGYGNLAMKHEGHDIAKWLNGMGITGAVLEYRMDRGGYQHPIPLLDAQRALRTIRFRADELNLDPARIGILGFSAGGHLASTAGTHFDEGDSDADDLIDRVSCRPDFMILCYPVIALGESYTHKGSQRRLIGENPPEDLVRSLSNEKQVTTNTPPTFLFHTDEDTSVPPENSIVFYQALHKAGVPAELHIYQKGRHGRGLAKDIPGTADWPNACKNWLQVQGLIPTKAANKPFTQAKHEIPKNLDIYLLIGQSNMAGRAPFTDKESGAITGAYLFTDKNQWEPAKNPLNQYSTIRKEIGMQKMNPGFNFAKTMLEKKQGVSIGLVVNAKGGTKIEEWKKGTEFYNEAIRLAKEAQKTGTLKGILWHQGESNSKNPQGYLDQLKALITDLRTDLNIPDLPFIAGQINNVPSINDQIAKLPQTVPATGFVSSEGLAAMDKWHFDTNSMMLLGQRYAEEMLKIQKEK